MGVILRQPLPDLSLIFVRNMQFIWRVGVVGVNMDISNTVLSQDIRERSKATAALLAILLSKSTF